MSDDLHALAAAYALDALDPLERRRFEAHYPECTSCADEVAGFRETAAHLPAATPAAPPPGLKAAVMADIERTRQLPPQVAGTSKLTRAAPSNRLTIGLAAAVVLIALVGFAMALSSAGGNGADQELAAVLAAPDAVTVELDGETDATLRLVYAESQERAVLVGSDLDGVDDEETYQLWTISDEGPASAGVFVPGDDGAVERSVDAPASGPDAWAVTVEPAGGSSGPTGEILFQGTA